MNLGLEVVLQRGPDHRIQLACGSPLGNRFLARALCRNVLCNRQVQTSDVSHGTSLAAAKIRHRVSRILPFAEAPSNGGCSTELWVDHKCECAESAGRYSRELDTQGWAVIAPFVVPA